jgi:hypothetical protein
MLLILFICLILGVGLWRLMMWTPKSAQAEVETEG